MKIDLNKVAGVLFPDKPLHEYSGKELGLATLGLIAGGALMISLITAPNLAKLFTRFGAKEKSEQWRLYQRIKRLEEKGYIAREGRWYAPTAKGERFIAEALLRKKPTTRRWDGRWHMVIFDLPAKHARARFDLNAFLREVGFVHYQKSVFVHQHDVRAQVAQFCDLYGIGEYVNFVTASHFDNEVWLKSLFTKKK